jgi:hypothetical protein
LADDQQKRFIEFPDGGDMTTYDLNTVQLIQPGKFTIIYTVVSNPGFMRLELKALDILREYCKRDDGLYPAPTDLLTLGPPDMPVKNIEVKNVDAQTKRTSWSYPYSKFAWPDGRQYGRVFFCKRPLYRTQDEEYSEARRVIMHGIRVKQLYDCKRGLHSSFVDVNDDLTKAIIGTVRKGTMATFYYASVCRAVTHEEP